MSGKAAPARQNPRGLDDAELEGRIARLRGDLGEELVILGHHYQSDAVIGQVDLTGDSLKLSQQAARMTRARHIVFCGVRFMAETASILAGPGQSVHLPEPGAGCPMADMAAPDELRACWRELSGRWGDKLLPVTYVNSSAEVKAFCGRRGGAACTSANAKKVLAWALDQGRRVLFLPDRHLGANAALDLGLQPEELCLWRRRPGKLLGAEPRSRVILWDGYCPVHVDFTVGDIKSARSLHPGCVVMVHPECPRVVVEAADASGSTEQIIAEAERLPPGSVLVVGTEINLVRRLARQCGDKTVLPLAERRSACPDMARTNLGSLLACLEGLDEGAGLVKVAAEEVEGARQALERMMLLT